MKKRLLILLGALFTLSIIAAACDSDDGDKNETDVSNDQGDDVQLDGVDQDTSDDVMPDQSEDTPDDAPDIPSGPPEVTATTPEDGATAVSITTAIAIEFNKPINQSTLNAESLLITPAISGDLFWDDATRRATFRPNVYLQQETVYSVTATTAIADPSGQSLESDVSFSFTTGDSTIEPGDTSVYEANGETVAVTISQPESETRGYLMTTTANLRDNDPPDKEVEFSEQAGQPILRSGHDIFDALFALSVHESRQNSVESISDFAFNQGNGVPCSCFETGAKWKYVWTRDTAYAVDLGLAVLDPTRARNSLNFKLSERKAGGDLQIVQDTGSGGSWPVSSDRVVWALGALEALRFLEGTERDDFLARTYQALQNTIAHDRATIFVPEDGLYKGEQSFLDWREQSYPSWTEADTVHIGMSRTLSTNVAHYILLDAAARLAEETGDSGAAQQYADWASDLSTAINNSFWLEDEGMYAAMVVTELDPSVTRKFDLLGSALAILSGVAPTDRTARVLQNYPHTEMGPPVLWPQQPLIPVYHNRGIWPFVTAYALLAARKASNDAVFDHNLESLVRGAALNLSNMENFEFTTLQPWFDDGIYSGPVVNSRRQLWSVAGYFGAVTKGVFGQEATQSGIRFQPFVTPEIHNRWFANTTRVELRNLTWRGVELDIELLLPLATGSETGGAYQIDAIFLNGTGVGDAFLTLDDFQSGLNTISIELSPSTDPAQSINLITETGDFRNLWSPRDPRITDLSQNGGSLQVTFDTAGESGITANIYRNGTLVETNVSSPWTDPDADPDAARTWCYTVETVFSASGNRSHHARPMCWWGPDFERIHEFSAEAFQQVSGGSWASTAGVTHYMDWGDPNHELAIPNFRPDVTGPHFIQLVYGNGAGPIDTGITAAVKEIIVEDASTGMPVGGGTLVMPHLGNWNLWAESSLVRVELDANTIYRIRIVDGTNMSYFAHFEPYTAGLGGGTTTFNRVNIGGLKILPIDGTPSGRTTGNLIPLDGNTDVADFPSAQVVTPGATLSANDRFALTWDEDYLYIAVHSAAFSSPYKPFSLYLEVADGALPPNTGSQGIEYSNLVPELPFAPTHLVSVRQLSDDGSAFGPWNGLWTHSGGTWTRLRGLMPDEEWWSNSSNSELSMRIPLIDLGNPTRMRVAGHVVNEVAGDEWKGTVPDSHTPWMSSATGYYEIHLSADPASSNWTRE